MSRGKSPHELSREWQAVPKNWFDIYQWRSLANAAYTEQIAALILNDLVYIVLNKQGLRDKLFKLSTHHGQLDLQTSIQHFTEKRFVRALFNLREVMPLGTILDYEIPLKATREAKHGDVDLLSLNPTGLHIIEAKAKSPDSLLKAMLQAFTYTFLVHRVKAVFLGDYELDAQAHLIPTVLTLSSMRSGEQLVAFYQYPNLRALLGKLNDELSGIGEGPIEFYLCENSVGELRKCLTVARLEPEGEKIVFQDGFQPLFRRIE